MLWICMHCKDVWSVNSEKLRLFMSDQLVFHERTSPHGLTMENMFHVADCCRACLRIECSLTPTTAPDNDSIKFCDKLIACVSEVVSGFSSTN